MKRTWSNSDYIYLKNNYYNTPMIELMSVLGRTANGIRMQASLLGLNRNLSKFLSRPYIDIDKSFFDNWNSSMAYILGFLYAEGSISQYRSLNLGISERDDYLFFNILRVMNSKYKVRYYEKTRTYHVAITNPTIVKSLIKIGLHDKVIPSVPDIYRGNFILGYFDGDGCITCSERYYYDGRVVRYPRSGFSDGSFSILRGIRDLLVACGLSDVNILHRGSVDCYDIYYSMKDSIKLFNLLYGENIGDGLFLKRKYDRFIYELECCGGLT